MKNQRPDPRRIGYRLAASCMLAGALVGMPGFLVGCRDQGDSSQAVPASAPQTWRPLTPSDVEVNFQPQRAAAESARQAMFGSLMAELSKAIELGGIESAISVCSDRAPKIAEEVGFAHAVRIGRTSSRLRNDRNAPPSWATGSLDASDPEPKYFVDDDGMLGSLTPIRLAANCLACHGSPSQIAPEVARAIQDQYPTDTATGYAEGDLRGWFWVEVAKP